MVQKSNCLDVSYRVDFAPFCQILSEICKFRENDGITVLQQLSNDFPQRQWRAGGVWEDHGVTDVWIAFLSFVELISLTDRSCIVMEMMVMMEMMKKMFMAAIL